jgi:fumarylacetoacetate (FAA) hydrolase family protein
LIESLLIPEAALPADGTRGSLVGRVWHPGVGGPSLVRLMGDDVIDITAAFPTCRDLCETSEPSEALKRCSGSKIGRLADLLANSQESRRDSNCPYFLAPVDLQVIKAAGVTFATSLIERVIEERARGDAGLAAAFRAEVLDLIGTDLAQLRPGSSEARALKDLLIARGAWSQYLEVGIGPDVEIFTKAPLLSAVGTGACAGLHPLSEWNNPEPEVVVAVASTGRIVGAMLGNDVNLRDFEGRSALLLGKAKDNNASAAIGPFLRLFDDTFPLPAIEREEVTLTVRGQDNFVLEGRSSMKLISRSPKDIVSQTIGRNHQYPDGFVLFLGTMFSPVADRDAKGRGFTHKEGDVVSVASPGLGTLVNEMRKTDACTPWTFGVGDLMRNLGRRKLI